MERTSSRERGARVIDPDELFEAASELYAAKGMKFTMDELSQKLRCSKRTLYETIESKEQLSIFAIERYFETVAAEQEPIRNDDSLCPVEKLRRVLATTPDQAFIPANLGELYRSQPEAAALLDKKLREGWDRTFAIIDEGVEAGVIRPVNKRLFAAVFGASILAITSGDANFGDETFQEVQHELVDLLIDGITVK